MVDSVERLDDVRRLPTDLLREAPPLPERFEVVPTLRAEARKVRRLPRAALEVLRLELPRRELLLFDALFFIKLYSADSRSLKHLAIGYPPTFPSQTKPPQHDPAFILTRALNLNPNPNLNFFR